MLVKRNMYSGFAKRIIQAVFAVLVIAGAFYFFVNSRGESSTQLVSQGDSVRTANIPKKVNNPPGLRFTQITPKSYLTVEGVVAQTNVQRNASGLPALSVNSKLNLSALRKAQDILNKQYFEHVSPDGVDVSGLASDAGYQYIVIGENLALGNFTDDTALLEGWMNSPGHRANILNTKYTEIGVAVLKGTYEGSTTWVAVQHFGFPLSACTLPDDNAKTDIANNNRELEALAAVLTTMQEELESASPADPSYKEKVDEYNAKVVEYNELLDATKAQISAYNAQVNAFNDCAD